MHKHSRVATCIGVRLTASDMLQAEHPDPSTVHVHASIHGIPAAGWDACAGSANPFVRHAFLAALEDSRSAVVETGWAPRHLAVHDIAGRLQGCMPLYLKSHSYGEYVFDWGWAEAFERAGGRYYPKLQCAVPFTPVTGPRLLLAPGAAAETADRLIAGALALLDQSRASSLHVTFPTEAECRALAGHGLLTRVGHQYHWVNHGYRCFDDFLAELASRKRKAIRKEREAVAASGLRLRALSGGAIEPRHWQAFYAFYRDTTERKYAHAYLTRSFFDLLGQRMADDVVMMVAETASGEVIAAALNLLGAETLYGRYWGCAEAGRFLHFELCYYRAIDFALERGLARVEAGAQGEHKVQRGYLPQRTWSAHRIVHPGLRRAVAGFLDVERKAIEGEIAQIEADSPFRCDLSRGT